MGFSPQEELPEEEFREEPPSDAQSQLLTVRADSELARQAGGEGERESDGPESEPPPVTQAQLLAEGSDREGEEPPVSGEGGEQSSSSGGSSDVSTSHGINISQETYQSLERETLSESQSSFLNNQDISKDNSIISTQSQESHCLTISVTGESNSLDNASQKLVPVFKRRSKSLKQRI